MTDTADVQELPAGRRPVAPALPASEANLSSWARVQVARIWLSDTGDDKQGRLTTEIEDPSESLGGLWVTQILHDPALEGPRRFRQFYPWHRILRIKVLSVGP